MDYLDKYKDHLNCDGIRTEREKFFAKLNAKGMTQAREKVAAVPEHKFTDNDFTQSSVRFGKAEDLTAEEQADLHDKLYELRPWRKGPFNIAGIQIDTEWRSDLKWDRVREVLKPMTGHKVCDIGANSGYHMYRMLEDNPEMVLGLDPTIRYYNQFTALQKLTADNQLHFEGFGLEQLHYYPKFFDTMFCMGILYHHSDPVGILREMYKSMAVDGQLIVECQGIPGDMPVALFPDKMYAKVRGTYFLPTPSCLVNWMKKAYFEDIKIFHVHDMTSDEQRSTEWCPTESYSDFVDEETGLTVEGYPAPIRIYAVARRGNKQVN